MQSDINAKVDEFLKSYELRELNLNDLDQVSGGTGETISVNGKAMSKNEFNNFVLAMFDEAAPDAACNLFIVCTGWQHSGTFGGSRSEMEALLAQYCVSVENN